jgi:sugar/nucleoside kinase (ribokinase family)
VDVLGFGCVAVDDFCYATSYPAADVKIQVLRQERRFGGLIGNALVAAVRLGARCAYEGVLGHDDLSLYAVKAMESEGIDLSRVERNGKAGPVHSHIIVGNDHGTRNIFFDFSRLFPPGQSALKDAVGTVRVLMIDHYNVEQKLAAVRFAREKEISIVADFEGIEAPCFPKLLEAVDHLILSHDFAVKLGVGSSPAAIIKALWNGDRKAVVITCGAKGGWFVTSASDKPRKFPAYAVKAVDTTGCGDVFHGAYAASLARRLPVEECLRLASAAAALKASRPAGPNAIPGRKEVERFLRQSSS